MRQSVIIALMLLGPHAISAPVAATAKSNTTTQTALAAAVSAPTRTATNVARDKYRNPAETLAFFGVKPTHKVVEIWPGGGWYTEILAPYLASAGALTIASPVGRPTENIAKKLDADPKTYSAVVRRNFPSGEGATAVEPGSADVVLTFRNVHNWRFGGADKAQAAFDEIYAMLKPGGILGIVEHRLPENMDTAREEKSGYMKRSSVIAFATKAGFKLSGESAMNANPRDTHDYPKGVWTLPPNYAEKDVDRERYAAIGESDRMTLKFIKPRR
jgi:predicted methyltransferase